MAEGGRRVLIATSSFAAMDDTPLRLLEAAGLAAVPNPHRRKLTRSELLELLAEDVVGLLAGLEELDREVLACSHLKVVSRVGSGMSNVDVTAAGELGIAVCSTPDAPVTAVAELTVGAMLAMVRQLPQMSQALHEGVWDKRIGGQLEGKTVAIVGFGRIGRRVGELLTPFRVRLLAVDPYLDGSEVVGVPLLPLEAALPLADIITLHVGGEECLLDEPAFGLMKDGVFVLNAARGGLIDEEALVRALDSGKVAGAWLDTFTDEPYAGPLRAYPNVLLTPHVGSYTDECRRRMETEAVQNLLHALDRA